MNLLGKHIFCADGHFRYFVWGVSVFRARLMHPIRFLYNARFVLNLKAMILETRKSNENEKVKPQAIENDYG